MTPRPHVTLSCATSLDGYLDDTSPNRLILSTPTDFARVDAVRAGSDAILIGAGTLRADNPALLIRDPALRTARTARGQPEHPTKVLLTSSGVVQPSARFFTQGTGRKLIYSGQPDHTRGLVGSRATVRAAGSVAEILADLSASGVGRLLVEGGGGIHTLFLSSGLVDELHWVIAPFFVGQAAAPRFVHPGVFPWGADNPARLISAQPIGELVFLRYAFEPSSTALPLGGASGNSLDAIGATANPARSDEA